MMNVVDGVHWCRLYKNHHTNNSCVYVFMKNYLRCILVSCYIRLTLNICSFVCECMNVVNVLH
jgi:hypothetical protein